MILKYLSRNSYISLAIVFLIFLLDRISKIYVIYLSNNEYSLDLFSSKFLNIRLIWNKGIAFGFFSFDQRNLYDLLTVIILIVIILILIMIINNSGLKKYSLLMIFGGAIGNVYDRIFYKAVPDFIDLHIGHFHWFIFNVADIFITVGVIFMILIELFVKNKKL
jgi:signal peptidase II